jgi:hypothetical protein
MNSAESVSFKKKKIRCSICHSKIQPGEEFQYHSKTMCESCCLDIRTRRVRKTHWQYLGSIKTEYLIPGEFSKTRECQTVRHAKRLN